jgi:prepilin-type N-terminal cleavage/methylation domain
MKTSRFIPAQTAQQGFTLIEVLIAMFILTIGILGAGAMQISALSGNSEAKQVTRSVIWSADHFERFMNLPFNAPQLQGTVATLADLDRTDGPGGNADGRFTDTTNPDHNVTVFWNVANNHPMFGCKTIRVTVRRFGQGLDKAEGRTISMDLIRMGPL